MAIRLERLNDTQARLSLTSGESYVLIFPSGKNFADNGFLKTAETLFDTFADTPEKVNEKNIKNINVKLYLSDYEMIANISLVLDKDEERKRIGNRIKELRKKQKITAKQLSKFSGIAPCNISRVESGLYSIGFDMLTKIASVLGCRVDLVEEDPPEHQKKSNIFI